MSTLSPRQQQIVTLLLQGLKYKEIAARLNLSQNTVRNHLVYVYDKVGVRSRMKLAAMVWGGLAKG